MKKPDRSPDHVTTYGSAFWWDELVYMSATGTLRQIMLEAETGNMVLSKPNDSSVAALGVLHPRYKELYDKWLIESFETNLFGELNDS